MFMRFEKHTIFLTYPKTPFARSEFSPLLWKMSLGHGMQCMTKPPGRRGVTETCIDPAAPSENKYDMQLKSLLVSQVWWPKTHQLWMIHIEKNCTGNWDPLLRLRHTRVGEDSPHYIHYITLVISQRGRRAFFFCEHWDVVNKFE